MKTIKLLILTIAIIFASCTKKENTISNRTSISHPITSINTYTTPTGNISLICTFLLNKNSTFTNLDSTAMWYSINNGPHIPFYQGYNGYSSINNNYVLDLYPPIGTIITLGYNTNVRLEIEEINPLFTNSKFEGVICPCAQSGICEYEVDNYLLYGVQNGVSGYTGNALTSILTYTVQ